MEADQRLRKNVRLIHTSDIHLGDEAGHPAAEAALQALVEAVPALRGDMLLLVGDIFDNGRVGDDVLQGFLDQVARLDVPAVLLPGNHDLYAEDSVYLRRPFHDMPGNLHILTDTGGHTISFPELTLDVWGRLSTRSGFMMRFIPLARSYSIPRANPAWSVES